MILRILLSLMLSLLPQGTAVAPKTTIFGASVPPFTHSFGRSFDGSTQADQSSTTISFSSATTLTVWFWVAIQSGIGADSLCMESSANINSNTGAFFVNCHPSLANGALDIAFNNGTNIYTCQVSSTTNSPLSDGSWHSIMFVLGIGVNPNTCLYYFDGSNKAVTLTNSTTATSTFATNIVNIASRNQASLFAKLSLSDIAIWKADESVNVTNLNNGSQLPSAVDSANLISYFPMCASSGNEADKKGAWNWIPTGTVTRITASGTNVNCQ